MKQLKSTFRPRMLLLATALAASGVVCAQTTGAAAPAAPAGASTSTVPAACAGMEGTALSDCIKLNGPASGSASASTNASTSTSGNGSTSTSGNASTSGN